jgi:hypothetical protein
MNTCKTCKHWLPPRNPYREVEGTNVCARIPQYWDATMWAPDGESRTLLPEYEGVTAFTQDGSDYSADLLTLPDFGCTLHEPAGTPPEVTE